MKPASRSSTNIKDPRGERAKVFQDKLVDSLKLIFEQSITDLDNKLIKRPFIQVFYSKRYFFYFDRCHFLQNTKSIYGKVQIYL